MTLTFIVVLASATAVAALATARNGLQAYRDRRTIRRRLRP